MKTKFDVLLVGIKQKMKNAELELAQIETLIQNTQEEIASFTHAIAEIEFPSSGSSLAFREIYAGKRAYLQKIEDSTSTLSSLKAQKSQKQQEYQLYQLEFEKIKYLQKKEIDSLIAKIKQKEQNQLDEIAVMLFCQDRKGVSE